MTFDELMELSNEEILAGDYKASIPCTSPLIVISTIQKFADRFSKYSDPFRSDSTAYGFTNGNNYHADAVYYSIRNFKEYKRNWTAPKIDNIWAVLPKPNTDKALQFWSYYAEHIPLPGAKTPKQKFTVLVVPHLKTCSFLTESSNSWEYPFSKLASYIMARNEKKIAKASSEDKRKFILDMVYIDISAHMSEELMKKCFVMYPSIANGCRLTIFAVLKNTFGGTRIEIFVDADVTKSISDQKVHIRIGTSSIRNLGIEEAVSLFKHITDGKLNA